MKRTSFLLALILSLTMARCCQLGTNEAPSAAPVLQDLSSEIEDAQPDYRNDMRNTAKTTTPAKMENYTYERCDPALLPEDRGGTHLRRLVA